MLRFFGLTPDYKTVILEHTFLLMYYGGFTYQDVRSLSVPYRLWFIDRINKEFAKSRESKNEQSRAPHHNTGDIRALQGRSREQVPARMIRFD